MTLERVRPDAEGGAPAERICTRRERDRSPPPPGEKLARQTRLTYASVREQQDGAKLARGRTPLLSLEHGRSALLPTSLVGQGMS